MIPVLIFSCFPEATTVPVSHDTVRCGTQPKPPDPSLSPLGIKAKNNIMGVSTSLAVIKTITQLKRFAWLSKGLFDDLNPNQKHLVLLLTVWRLIIVYVITPVNVGFKKYKEDKTCSLQWNVILAKHLRNRNASAFKETINEPGNLTDQILDIKANTGSHFPQTYSTCLMGTCAKDIFTFHHLSTEGTFHLLKQHKRKKKPVMDLFVPTCLAMPPSLASERRAWTLQSLFPALLIMHIVQWDFSNRANSKSGSGRPDWW